MVLVILLVILLIFLIFVFILISKDKDVKNSNKRIYDEIPKDQIEYEFSFF